MITPYERFRRGWTAFWGTSYTCEVAPVEEYFLSRLSIDSLNATLLADLHCLDEAFAAVEPTRLRRLGRDYVLRPVYWPKGAFHPKTFLFGNQHGGVLLVGSGNAGISGLMRGHEIFSEFKCTPDEPSPEIAAWTAWMSQLVASLGDRLVENRWTELQTRLPWLRPSPEPSTFVHNWDTALIEQLIVAAGDRVDELHVSAPFFDPDVAAFKRLLEMLKPGEVSIAVADAAELNGRKLGDVLQTAGVPSRVFRFDPDRFVHGKLYAAITGDHGVVLAGSPNCSRSALLRPALEGNVEAGVLVQGPATAVRALFIPPGMVRKEMALGAVQNLQYNLQMPGSAWPFKLLRAEILHDGRLATALTPPPASNEVFVQPVGGTQLLELGQVHTETVKAFGDVMLAVTGQPLTESVAFVALFSGGGVQVSNRVALDDPARLQLALQPRDTRAAVEKEVEDEELDRDVLEVLNELRAGCSFDVRSAKRRRREQAVAAAAVGDASFWDELGPIEAKQRKRTHPGRFYGRLDEEGMFAQLRAMLLEAPYMPTLRLISLLDETSDDDEEEEEEEEEEQETRPARSWSAQARKRVRVRNILHRWFRSVADPQMREFDPDLCLSNYLVMLRGLARLWYGDGQTRLLDRNDLSSLWLELFGALVRERSPVGLLAGVDTRTRERLSEQIRSRGADTVAALLAFDALSQANREGKLAWQPLLNAGLDWRILGSSDQAVMQRIQEVIDFIDDREWCRLTGEKFGVSLAFKAGGFHEEIDCVLGIGSVGNPNEDSLQPDGSRPGAVDLLADPRIPQIALACLAYKATYKACNTLVLETTGRWDRVALKQDDTALVNAAGNRAETEAVVWQRELEKLASKGAGLNELAWRGLVRLA